MATQKQAYLDAYLAFEPAADDNPDCIPYYRAAAGLRAAWGAEFCDRYQHAYHPAFCAAGAVPAGEGLRVAREILRDLVGQQVYQTEPRVTYSWQARPAEPTEQDAKAFFNEEYKRRFPGQRAGSKHANGLWPGKADACRRILREQHEKLMVRYEAEEERVLAENRRRHGEWQAECNRIAGFISDAQRILGEGA